jgi:hypothetical protein
MLGHRLRRLLRLMLGRRLLRLLLTLDRRLLRLVLRTLGHRLLWLLLTLDRRLPWLWLLLRLGCRGTLRRRRVGGSGLLTVSASPLLRLSVWGRCSALLE